MFLFLKVFVQKAGTNSKLCLTLEGVWSKIKQQPYFMHALFKIAATCAVLLNSEKISNERAYTTEATLMLASYIM